MKVMSRSLLSRWLLGAAFAAASSSPLTVFAQDRVVGREALDPKDQENLPKAIDGRTDADEDVDPRALEEFREPLAPHGAWIDDPRYGTIWVPDARVVGSDFTPYQTAGHWELTSDADWLWVSDYAWGDIPFHYGRWVWVDGRGWAWIPGRVWAPAWVVWRTGPYGYIGWGPCPPTWGWYGGAASWLWWPPPAPYWFVETRYVFVDRVHTHVIREPARVSNAARQTTPLRRPARPASGGLDAHRPARPDFDQLRYAGPAPKRSALQHPEVGPPPGRRAVDASGAATRPASTRPKATRADGGFAQPRRPREGRGDLRPQGRDLGADPSPRRPRRTPPGPETRGVDPTPDTSPTPERSTPDRAPRTPRPSSADAPSRDLGPRDVRPSASPDRGAAPAPRPSTPAPVSTVRRPAPSSPAPAPVRAPQRGGRRVRR